MSFKKVLIIGIIFITILSAIIIISIINTRKNINELENKMKTTTHKIEKLNNEN